MTNLEFKSKIWAVDEHSSIQSTLIQTELAAVLPEANSTSIGQTQDAKWSYKSVVVP